MAEAQETRTRRRIRGAVEKRGGHLLYMHYERPHGMILMEGPGGGWSVEAEHPCQPNPACPMYACGYTAEQVIKAINEWPLGEK